MCCPKGWAGCLNGVALLSKIPVPPFGTLYTQYCSFSFYVEVLHWKGNSILCAPRSCTGKDLLGTLLSPISRTYFAALAVFHSFLALKERRIKALTKTLYMARRSIRLLFISVAEGRAELRGPEAGSKLASFGYGCRAGVPGAVSALRNHKWNIVHAQAFSS
jgi:hypothetical protein